MDRYIFNEFINLKGFGLLLKQASGFLSCALVFLGYFRITACSFPRLSQHKPFTWYWEMVSSEEWDLGMIFRSEVVCFYRINILEQLSLLVISTLNNP